MSEDSSKLPKEFELEGHRTFVIGDIHGCAKELEALLVHIEQKEQLQAEDVIVFIGDYIDRGPDSRRVIELLLDFNKRARADVYHLHGNHEEMLLSWLGLGGSGEEVYLVNGGEEFLKSYGVDPIRARDKAYGRAAALESIPAEHLKFFQGLDRYLLSESFIFVHAGLNPLRDLLHQINEDIFWIRDEFIYNVHYFQKTVIFGHTPFEDVMFNLPYKIGIDTGLVYGNALTALELSEERVLQVESASNEVEEFSFREKGGLWPKVR